MRSLSLPILLYLLLELSTVTPLRGQAGYTIVEEDGRKEYSMCFFKLEDKCSDDSYDEITYKEEVYCCWRHCYVVGADDKCYRKYKTVYLREADWDVFDEGERKCCWNLREDK